jgi:GT2 family glycosyltransferase
VSGFRFDPVDTAGKFRLESIRIEPVSRLFVLRKALCSALWSFRCNRATLSALAGNLCRLACGQIDQLKQRLLENLGGPSLLAPPPYDPSSAYAEWRRRRQLTAAERARMRVTVAAMTKAPLISMLMKVAEEPAHEIRQTLESLADQAYPHWELCAGPDWNTLLDRARGDFVGFLNPADRLAGHALFAMARRAASAEMPDMVYSDEDYAATEGARPFFKPDWSPEYLLSFPYTGRLALYRTAVVRELGGLRTDFGHAFEYDLVLRLAARSQKIEHVPDVLYHTSPTRQRGPDTSIPGAPSALREHLQATGRQGSVEPGPAPGLHRVRFAIGQPRVSLIIPTAYRKRPDGVETFLERCLDSIRSRSTYVNFQILLLDNGKMPSELAGVLGRMGVIRVPYELPFNWAAAINQGAARADGDQLLILDDDTEVITPDWIECLLEYSQQPQIGVVGARLDFPDGRLQHAGVTVLDGVPGHPFYRRPPEDAGYFYSSIVPRNWSAVTGACLMTRADVFREVGGFDEDFGLNFNDIDYCLRVARSGRRIVCTPFARLHHHETATKAEFLPAELEAFKNRWQRGWPVDPFTNPHLSKRFHDFRLASFGALTKV